MNKDGFNIFKTVGIVDDLRRKINGETIETEDFGFDHQIEPSGKLYKISGYSPQQTDGGGNSLQSKYVKIDVDKEELEQHLKSWDEDLPPGQQRTVHNFIQYLRKKNVEAELFEVEAYKDIT